MAEAGGGGAKERAEEGGEALVASVVASAEEAELLRKVTLAAKLPKQLFGQRVQDLHMDSLTVTEILRLHLLSSGARVSAASQRFRSRARGGFCSSDDAGFQLLRDPRTRDIIRLLESATVFELEPGSLSTLY